MSKPVTLGRVSLLLFFQFLSLHALAQHFFLFETTTLAEGTINPETEVFHGSDCKRVAFNFFIPTVHLGAIVYGPARKFIYDSYLFDKINKGAINANPLTAIDYIAGDFRTNILSFKLKLRGSLRGEFLIDYSLRGIVTGSLVNGLFGLSKVTSQIQQGANAIRMFNHYLNTNSYYVSFGQLSAGYRKNFDDDLSGGFMVGLLSGISAGKLSIGSGSLNYLPQQSLTSQQQVLVRANGYLLSTKAGLKTTTASQFNSAGDYLPNFRNPGINLSAGLRYRVTEQSAVSINLKDLGFIVWRQASKSNLLPSTTVGVKTFDLSSELKKNFRDFFSSAVSERWVEAMPVKLEPAYSNRFFPFLRSSLVVSKPLLSSDVYVTALNDVFYKNFHAIINAGYDSRNATDWGLHLLYRSAACEVFIGSERLLGLTRLPNQLAKYSQASKPISSDINFGAAFKLGSCFFTQTATDMHLDGKRPGFLKRFFQL